MTEIGIEALHAYAGLLEVDAQDVALAVSMDSGRSANLGLHTTSVALPTEDTVSFAVNAARPLVADEHVRETLELVIVATESGVDWSKSTATWVHRLLGLPRHCRLLELKQACSTGVAGLQLAVGQLALSRRRSARALVIASDVPLLDIGSTLEPSQGAGAVAMLVGSTPTVAVAEPGAAGYCSFEVSDFSRPTARDHLVDTELSLMSYVESLRGAYADFVTQVPGTDVDSSFEHFVFHTPFPTGVRGFHRALLQGLRGAAGGASHVETATAIAQDFEARVAPSLRYPALVGNCYAATTPFALLSLLDAVGNRQSSQRVGVFSYGSGCSAEFCRYELPAGQWTDSGLSEALARRWHVSVAEYRRVVEQALPMHHGAADYLPDLDAAQRYVDACALEPVTMLAGIHGYHRDYVELTPSAIGPKNAGSVVA